MTSATVVLATHNAHKVAELARILEGLVVALRSGRDLDLPEVDETGATFAENALLKARAAHAATGLAAVADDSGLVVDALDGDPGVRSARYAGEHGDDAANLRLVLERMRGVEDRGARFVCAAALVTQAGEWVREGTLDGTLVAEPRGTGGFGYDPLLVPQGELGRDTPRTCAELTPEEKDAISHRGAAFRALRPVVVEALAVQ
ncbi:RdgB/HAM1 family non-canonical purine NTP pyrophosphatase [Egibacter rhizosphaerae]|uniref:dITP/XTP pyrophosphatase n=1 Tax=Egibacter rhizosphaerae TaxID=1670831 RepID=A0A411YC06_9ACTN|nr:RdgB/HAM1 family non-canonical purine NTP pyrophosphatase [Egibacter rhizosphaerae]QBI18739.1 RdgB/HAM1 family non-canonical purine NTP pyrophosphatase [Egibacter rhizosphaerae]